MFKIIRMYNKNRILIWIIIIAIVAVIGLLKILNGIVVKNKQSVIDNNTKEEISSSIENTTTYNSNKSPISGVEVPKEVYKEQDELIRNFIDDCNTKKYAEAYTRLSEECKKEMFPTLDSFQKIYCETIFDDNKNYKIQNWEGSTYKITFYEDVLSTGNVNAKMPKVDYYTIVDNGEKLNINTYIGERKIDTKKEKNGLEFSITKKECYMEFVIYEVEINNNSTEVVCIDDMYQPKGKYLIDDKEVKSSSYLYDKVEGNLTLQKGEKVKLRIKFITNYMSDRNFNKLVFEGMTKKSGNSESNIQFYLDV